LTRAGYTDGAPIEVAFRPAQHVICRVLGELCPEVARALSTAGYERFADLDNAVSIWTRRRSCAERANDAGLLVLEGGRR
jgi:hypothetical protein